MEELRSTEILDREIEADAQKKAKKILSKAEDECQEILNSVDEKVNSEIANRMKFYADKNEKLKASVESYVPLEKERFLAAFYEDEVCKSLNEYFNSIGKQKRTAWLEKKLNLCKEVLENQNVTIKGFGEYDLSEIQEFGKKHFSSNFKSAQIIQFEKSMEVAEKCNDFHSGMIIESEDKSVKIRLTMDEIVREIKDKYSNELATTLFGGNLPK